MKWTLTDGWKLYEAPLHWGKDRLAEVLRKDDGAYACDLPCDVRMPLIQAGVIRDPVQADYFRESLWVEQRSWWFVKEFDWQGGEYDAVELTLDRLDFGADILLNGVPIGRHDSVHYPFVKDVRQSLIVGRNTLAVRLTCGLETVTDLDVAGIDGMAFTEEGNGCKERGDRRRAFLRKPQYVFGWDWCPRAATCGVGFAELKAYRRAAIRNVMFSTVSIEGAVARVKAIATVESLLPTSTQDGDIMVELSLDGRKAARAERSDVLLLSGLNHIEFDLEVPGAKLWWPNGYGGQPLYDLAVTVKAGGAEATHTQKAGIRTLELDTTRLDGSNRRFAIRVNGALVQCKGGNWIPSDSLYARITDAKYERLITDAKEANFTMLRMWGGGLYERDVFYDLCDRLGILVWQDFMFGCAAYPDYLESFQREVYHEFEYQTLRLGSRASLAVLCGNNENHWAVHAQRPDLGGLYAYNSMAPAAVRRNCPHVPWWPSSPYGGAFPNDNDVGDRHHWSDCMMNPEMEKRITPEEYDLVESRFVSEYGYPGPCPMKSIEQYFGGQPVDRNGEIWNLHNNTFEKHTVAAGIRKHYVDPEDLSLPQYLLYAQAVQALMLGYSLEAIQNKPECWGSLFWMYNDCWGETGWTIVDYYLRRKPAFYAVKRVFSPLRLVLREQDGAVSVTAHNETGEAVEATVEYGFVTLGGQYLETHTATVTAPPRGKTVVFTFPAAGQDDRRGLWFARSPEFGTAILRRRPFRELELQMPGLSVSSVRDDGADRLFTVSADRYAHAVHLSFGDDARLSDEYFDLLPGEQREVRAYGQAGKAVEVYSIYPEGE